VRNRKVSETDILSGTESYAGGFGYDDAGKLISKTDKETKTTGYTYDDLNRLAKVTDAKNQETIYTYDNRNNLIALTDAEGQITRFEYDKNNRLKKEIRPAGEETTYGYDAVGRFNSAAWNVGGAAQSATYTYVPNSDLLHQLTTTSGQATIYTYEPNRNLKTSIENAFGVNVISKHAYQYDAVGRRTSVTNSGTAFTQAAFNKFGYNGRSELTNSDRFLGSDVNDLSLPVDPETRLYSYDPIGNRTTSTEGTESSSYTTNSLNQYEQ